MTVEVSFLGVPSIISKTETLSSGSTGLGPGSISGKAIKRLGEAVLNGVDYILINREFTRIESFFRQNSTNRFLNVENTEGMYRTLFELTHPGYTKSVRTRALKIVMKRIGGMSFKILARALVHLDSWSTTYRQLSSAIACCWRSGKTWLSDTDYHTAGYESYRSNHKGGLSSTEPISLYLALVALIGSRNHARMIFDLLSSANSEVAAAKRPEDQEALDGLLKRVLTARMALEEDDSSISDATAVLGSAVLEDEPSYFYPHGHVSNVLVQVAGIMSPTIPSIIATSPSIITGPSTMSSSLGSPTADSDNQVELFLNPELQINHGIIKGATLEALLEFLVSPKTPASYVSLNLRIFAMTFKTFATLDELFNLLALRLSESPSIDAPPEAEEEWTEIFRSRVLSILVALTHEDVFDINSDMHVLSKMEQLLLVEKTELSVCAKAQSLLSIIRRSRIAKYRPRRQTQITIFPTEVFDDSVVVHGSPSSNLLGFKPSDLASQLTLIESSCYENVRPVDCLRYIDEPARAISDLINLNNTVAEWALLCVKSARDRVKVIEHLIETADECRRLHNYSTMVSLLTGLSISPVEEVSCKVAPVVKLIWAECSATALQIQTSAGFHNVMAALRSSPAIPVVGHVLTWLRTIESEHNDMVSDEQGMMNFNKRWKQHNVVDHYLWWRKYPYNLPKSSPIQHYLHTTFSSLVNVPMDGPSERFTL
ncbi:hypothetical protein PM082_024491 [Marasmius tenuissimus]|nr:hypothetical protein PM082_024491 [Marasmius tenuissimus]